MGHSIKKIAVIVLITSLVILTLLAVLAIWDVFSSDVAWKAISTMGVITFSSIVAMLVGRSLESKDKTPPKTDIPK